MTETTERQMIVKASDVKAGDRIRTRPGSDTMADVLAVFAVDFTNHVPIRVSVNGVKLTWTVVCWHEIEVTRRDWTD